MSGITGFGDCARAIAATNREAVQRRREIIRNYGSIQNFLNRSTVTVVCTNEDQGAFAAFYKKHPETLKKNSRKFIRGMLDKAAHISQNGDRVEKEFIKALLSVTEKVEAFCEANEKNFPLYEKEGTIYEEELVYVAFTDYLPSFLTETGRRLRSNTILLHDLAGKVFAASNFAMFSPPAGSGGGLTTIAIYSFVDAALRGFGLNARLYEIRDKMAMEYFTHEAKHALLAQKGFDVLAHIDWPEYMPLGDILENDTGGTAQTSRPVILGKRGFGRIRFNGIRFVHPGYGRKKDYISPGTSYVPACYRRHVEIDAAGNIALGKVTTPKAILAETMWWHYRGYYKSFETPYSRNRDKNRTSQRQLRYYKKVAGKNGQGFFPIAAQEVTNKAMVAMEQRIAALRAVFGDGDLRRVRFRTLDKTRRPINVERESPLGATPESLYRNRKVRIAVDRMSRELRRNFFRNRLRQPRVARGRIPAGIIQFSPRPS